MEEKNTRTRTRMGIAPSHFERDLDVLTDPSFEEREKDRTTERAKQRAMMMHSIIGFEGLEDIPGDLECSICAEVSFCICSAFFFFFSKTRLRAPARSVSQRERERSGVCGVSRDDVKNHSWDKAYETLQSAFTITKTLVCSERGNADFFSLSFLLEFAQKAI